METSGWLNVEFHHGDIHDLDVERRFRRPWWVAGSSCTCLTRLSCYASLADHLRPGGILAFQESDLRDPPRPFPPCHFTTKW